VQRFKGFWKQQGRADRARARRHRGMLVFSQVDTLPTFHNRIGVRESLLERKRGSVKAPKGFIALARRRPDPANRLLAAVGWHMLFRFK